MSSTRQPPDHTSPLSHIRISPLPPFKHSLLALEAPLDMPNYDASANGFLQEQIVPNRRGDMPLPPPMPRSSNRENVPIQSSSSRRSSPASSRRPSPGAMRPPPAVARRLDPNPPSYPLASNKSPNATKSPPRPDNGMIADIFAGSAPFQGPRMTTPTRSITNVSAAPTKPPPPSPEASPASRLSLRMTEDELLGTLGSPYGRLGQEQPPRLGERALSLDSGVSVRVEVGGVNTCRFSSRHSSPSNRHASPSKRHREPSASAWRFTMSEGLQNDGSPPTSLKKPTSPYKLKPSPNKPSPRNKGEATMSPSKRLHGGLSASLDMQPASRLHLHEQIDMLGLCSSSTSGSAPIDIQPTAASRENEMLKASLVHYGNPFHKTSLVMPEPDGLEAIAAFQEHPPPGTEAARCFEEEYHLDGECLQNLNEGRRRDKAFEDAVDVGIEECHRRQSGWSALNLFDD